MPLRSKPIKETIIRKYKPTGNTPDENQRIKAGEGEGLWNPEEGDNGDRTNQPDLQYIALRANRQAQPFARLKKHI